MRHDHIEISIREEMKTSSFNYCKTIHDLSISDIISLINYLQNEIEKPVIDRIDSMHKEAAEKNIIELKTYVNEFSGRLSNRTVNFEAPKN